MLVTDFGSNTVGPPGRAILNVPVIDIILGRVRVSKDATGERAVEDIDLDEELVSELCEIQKIGGDEAAFLLVAAYALG